MTPAQRRAAEMAAATCYTCAHLTPAAEPHGCLGCSASLNSYSCMPGYCPTCAHDPRLMGLEDAFSDDACAAHSEELERIERDFATDAAISEGMADALRPLDAAEAVTCLRWDDDDALDSMLDAAEAAIDAGEELEAAIEAGRAAQGTEARAAAARRLKCALAAVDQLDAAEGRPAAADLKAI